MNPLLEIQQKIEGTNEALSRLNRMLKDRPNAPGLLANMRTLERTQKDLQAQFAAAAKSVGLEVCDYRLINDGSEKREIFGIGRALVNFQSLFSVCYDAIKFGEPRATAHLHEGIWGSTQFDFAYSYYGSVGITMTVSPEVNLYDNPFDSTMQTIFEMAKVRTSEEMREHSRILGVAPVKALFKWADELAQSDFGVDVKWTGYSNFELRLLLQKSELISLRETISSMSDEQYSDFKIDGTLIAANVIKKTFGFQYSEGDEIRIVNGKFIDAIDSSHAATVPALYTASIRKTTRTTFSTEQDKVEYRLLKLEEI